MTGALKQSAMPLVGRSDEMAELRGAMDGLARGRGTLWLVSGVGGVGKTRLGQAVVEEAVRRDWAVASGRAFPVESGVPYALFADALQPVVRRMNPEHLRVMTRGVGELTHIFPWLAPGSPPLQDVESGDFRNRLHWHFTQFLRGLLHDWPLLVVLEDLQWADTSSLELLHFVARQMTDVPLFLFCTYNPEHIDANPSLRALLQSLQSLRIAQPMHLEPLGEPAVGELLHRMYGTDRSLVRDFTMLLYRWTRGNPFFVEETLKALVASGDLRQEDGRWIGWQVDALRLPPSIRDAVLMRLEVLSAAARDAADTAAVLGSRFDFDTLAAAVATDADALLASVDELRRARVLEEIEVGDDVVYDFVHPLIRETLYGDLGRVRVRLLHARVAAAIERRHGAASLERAGELAYHYARAQSGDADTKAIVYLERAGRDALAVHANREAADYLAAALERMQGTSTAPERIIDVVEALARARQRLGDYEEATALWTRVQQWAVAHGEPARAAAVARRLALACYWTGRLGEALKHLEQGLAWATEAQDSALQVRLHTARAACLQELGRFNDALAAAQQAMDAAGPEPDASLLVRVHRTFLQLHLWTGNARLAREHGTRALELIDDDGDHTLAFMVHWAMGVLEAFAGNSVEFDHHFSQTRRIADELRSPVLRAWSAELALEYASARGEWHEALQIGEEAIRLARALQQYALLPRLLVWTGLIHLGRSEIETGEAYIEEAWRISGAEHADRGHVNLHSVIPAFIGRAGVCMARGDHESAIGIAETGLALADRAGYILWGVHRLLPTIAEAYLWQRDLEGARRTGERLHRDAQRLGHRLGLAWSTACDALVAWLGGDSATGAVMLQDAACQLEAVPFMPDATRLRRQLAGRLFEIGMRDEAVRELRVVHDRLLYLGAGEELRKARIQFKEMGVRPPPLGQSRGEGLLTDRELGVASLVAERRSRKAIARELAISVRTVDAHLTNIYRKLSINTRAELADMVRDGSI
jgi:DNA-binding CsgD family transcriptional regulator